MAKRKIDTCKHADHDWPCPICISPNHPNIGDEDGDVLAINAAYCEDCGIYEQKDTAK